MGWACQPSDGANRPQPMPRGPAVIGNRSGLVRSLRGGFVLQVSGPVLEPGENAGDVVRLGDRPDTLERGWPWSTWITVDAASPTTGGALPAEVVQRCARALRWLGWFVCLQKEAGTVLEEFEPSGPPRSELRKCTWSPLDWLRRGQRPDRRSSVPSAPPNSRHRRLREGATLPSLDPEALRVFLEVIAPFVLEAHHPIEG